MFSEELIREFGIHRLGTPKIDRVRELVWANAYDRLVGHFEPGAAAVTADMVVEELDKWLRKRRAEMEEGCTTQT